MLLLVLSPEKWKELNANVMQMTSMLGWFDCGVLETH